jgi:hypothetical protein
MFCAVLTLFFNRWLNVIADELGGLRQFCCANFAIQRVKMCFSARRLACLRR